MTFEIVFFGAFACVAGYYVVSMVRHGGFKGAMFGSRVLRSVGEVSAAKRGLMSQKLKVHVLAEKSPGEGAVGIEFTSSAPGSWSTTPIRLSNSEVHELIRLLQHAISSEARMPGDPAA